MRSTSRLALVLASLLACGPNGGDETSSETSLTTAPPGTSSGGASTTTVTTTGDPTTTGEPGTTSSASSTSASTSGTSSTSSTSGLTTGVETTGVETTSGSSSDTGTAPAGACVTDEDCHLHDDCCDCYGLPVGQDDPHCDLQCKQSTCTMLGVDRAICRFGVCIAEPLDCNGSNVTCKSLPPECDAGSLPEVAGECWSGTCAPISNCNAVPECGLCPAGTMCVQKISKKQTWPSCEPVPADCAGEIDCECAGTFVCTGSFNICNDLGGNELSCGCPAC